MTVLTREYPYEKWLLGARILPSDVTPTTAVINRITYGDKPRAVLRMRDGSEREAELERLEDYVTKLTEEGERNAALIREAVIYYPTVMCQNNVDIIDTPGLNDDAAMTGVTIGNLDNVDAVIAVVSALSPFSQVECGFVCRLIEARNVHDVLFAVTFIDQLDEDERERMLGYIGERIGAQVLAELERREAPPEIMEKARAVVEHPRLFGVSARQALDSFAGGDRALLRSSGFEEFKQALFTEIISQQGGGLLEKVSRTAVCACEDSCSALEARAAAQREQAADSSGEIERLRDVAANADVWPDECFLVKYERLHESITDYKRWRIILNDRLLQAIRCCPTQDVAALCAALQTAANMGAAAVNEDDSFRRC